MNFRGGFSIPQPEELQLHGCWIPATPHKPPISARSNSIPENPQWNQVEPENWTQIVPNYNSLAQIFDTSFQVGRIPGGVGLGGNVMERNPTMNHFPNSYQQKSLPGDGASDWNDMPLMQLLLQDDSDFVVSINSKQSKDLRMASKRPLIPSSQPQASSVRGDCRSVGFSSGPGYRPEIVDERCQPKQDWIVSNSGNQQRCERIQSMGSELLEDGNVNGLTQIHRYDLPTPSKPSYDLNVSPAVNAAHLENAANLLHFTPVTPDLGRSLEKQRSESRSISDESTNKEKSGNLVQCPERAIEQNCDELLQNIVDSSSTLVSTPIKENRISVKKSDLGIDLNETPQQKPPKRRKHRPKVVVEGKPKTTRKPAVPKNSESIENRPAKRKYVRKKLSQNSRAQVDITKEATDSNTATAPKTCKRALNFDLEETGEKNENNVAVPQETGNRNRSILEVTINHQSTDLTGTRTMSSVQSDIPTRSESQIAGSVSAFVNQMPNGYVSLQDRQTVVPLATTKEMQMSYFYLAGRNEISRNTNQQQTRKVDEDTTKQQRACAEGLGQHGLKGKGNLANLEKVNPADLQKVKELMRSAFQPVPKTPSKSCEPRGLKRDHSQTAQQAFLSTTNHMASLSNGNTYKADELRRNSHTLRTGQENDKKRKTGEDYRQIQNMPFYVKVAEGGLLMAKSRTPQDLNLMAQSMKQNCSAILNPHFCNSRLGERGMNDTSKFTGDKYVHCIASGHNLPAQQTSPTAQSHPRKMGSASAYSPLVPSSLSENSTRQGHGQMFQTTYISTTGKNLMMRAPRANPALGVVDKVQENTPKRKGAKKKNAHPTTIDEIIYRLQILDLNETSAGLQNTNQNALVLYKGDGTLVPYQDVDIIKKRKPRPKVDLDSETNRVWNLLMGKEGSENMEETDEKKEKWWEEERKVFHGRVDSFIARMHLVQGDRRFTRWKGSVVDSVIGVFLTQNVSDHLSSSAFMSMVARFPLKTRTQDEVKTNIIDTEVPISMINPDDAIKWYEVSSEPTNQNIILREPVQYQWGNDSTGTSRNCTEAQNQSSAEELILSQDSFDSSITQVAGGIRSSSGSNSETEDPSTGCKPRNGQVSALTDYLQMEKSSMVQEVCSEVNECTVLNGKSKYGMIEQSQTRSGTMKHRSYHSSTILDNPYIQPPGPSRYNMLTSSRIPELWLHESFSEESTSSWQSPPSVSANGPEAVSMRSRTGEAAGSFADSYNKEQNGPWWSQETPITSPGAFLSVDFNNRETIPTTIPNIPYNQSSCISYQQEGNNMLSVKSTFSMEPGNNAEALNKQNATMPNANKLTETTVGAGDCSSAVNLQIYKENKMVEANSKEKISPSKHPSDLAKTRNSKPRKGNTKSEKKNAVDWDDLRRKVKRNGRKTERPKDAMDSLDYEAVRVADVREISDAIKERGMNNMLAERMKEFLNRVVRDHGSIDLEWLRDVPPDKAKDYLLSIQGLGLKSVECVRLLTLHHLAFPVDTNVGRIAVRLGWVPLQPLPESLQLHLLELYPILESIQKYLWPRLCKLDQRTLYELHYQMITFGKVFCTKSKPNCNACPMRGECRHFASAFASARLALPGPEERSIVSSTVPQTEDNNPGVVIHPLPLPAPEHSSVIEVGFSNSRKCEPIIEEPATPEQECIAISESDIEDYEDPDEIPTIKLDENKFKENLQSYMRNNMELQEADMSKALVALSPDIASIPIPKLKNVSRLRTEHQVYELPDSHPLLERLDRREPDDPSPYLLAIWTPGETANSIQPSEKSCSSEPDKLCSNATCFSCNSVRESNSQTVRGTILIPCRTAMRGSFPLNGTYFQVNEMFADHESSINPINVPRNWIWNLPRRMVYFGTSVSTIFKGLTTHGIQYCFWKGFVCVRGFDQATRAPRPLKARLHVPASKLAKTKNDKKK